MQLPSQLEIVPLVRPPHASIRVPGSKSITNRALVLAALAGRKHACELWGALRSEDTEIMVTALRTLGFHVESSSEHWATTALTVRNPSPDRIIPARNADLFVGNSGTSMRFLTGLVSLGQGKYRLDGVPRMRERPIGDLLWALNQLEGWAYSEDGTGYPPVIIEANRLPGGHVTIKGDVSSQFLSGLLMAVPLADADVVIDVDGPLVSRPYVDLTVAMMRDFGARLTAEPAGFRIPGGQRYELRRYAIEPDASAASYFWGAAAITGGEVCVEKLTSKSLQGDIRFVELLEKMGCQVVRTDSGITVHGGKLTGIDVDMNDISDTVMTLAAVACFADGPTTIRNVAHIRHKETDRMTAIATELRRLGAGVVEREDGLTITPGPMHGAVVRTYNDHRMAMSLALIGLKVPGIVIDNPACVAKTYPLFFDDLERLR
ncbi:MAG: 3-phosphoshikimate 1-carboxyvinyltransferase [Gemmataceae bacterium]|nr:3-phosphoshikimate 1-carboxyvinyltransferase [Gemmataceae bacterium]